MKVLELKSISKQEGCIYYLTRYTATAVLEIPAQTISFPLSFSIETGPLGNKTIEVDELPKDLNYPVFPVVKSLKEYIQTLSAQGNLP
jgi:hypothetical protein